MGDTPVESHEAMDLGVTQIVIWGTKTRVTRTMALLQHHRQMKRWMASRILHSGRTLMVGTHRMEPRMVVVLMDLERMGALCLLHHNQAYISDTYPHYLHSRSLIPPVIYILRVMNLSLFDV